MNLGTFCVEVCFWRRMGMKRLLIVVLIIVAGVSAVEHPQVEAMGMIMDILTMVVMGTIIPRRTP